MCRNAGEQRSGVGPHQRAPGGRALGEEAQSHLDGGDRIGGYRTLVAEQQLEHGVVAFDERPQQAAPRLAIAQLGAGAVQIVVADRCGPTGQRVGVRDLRHLQRDPAGGQVEVGEKWRGQCQRMHSRTDVVRHP
jgi:hypothetical protein